MTTADDKKTSSLTAASALTGAELVPVVQGGASKRTTVAAIRLPLVRSVSASGALTAADGVVLVDTTGGAVTLTLPAASGGGGFVVRRVAGSNGITVQRAGSDTIVRADNTTGNTTTAISDDLAHTIVVSASTVWTVLA